MKPTNRVAVALGLHNTDKTLATLNHLGSYVGLAEVRLDMMDEFDLERIVTASPCPLVITCRPVREGGNYAGDEQDRLAILTRASELNCAYVDVEWDSVESLVNKGESTKVIVSRHCYDTVIEDPWGQYLDLRTRADAVKLVGFASRVSDSLTMLELMSKADTPVIAIAMGPAGIATRMLAPCFDACLLTYGAINQDVRTAPGQISVKEMVEQYALHQISETTQVKIYLYTKEADESALRPKCGGGDGSLRIALHVRANELKAVANRLEALSPRFTVTPYNST